MEEKIVIAIDGPAGSGKTTIAKELSKKLNIPFFSTGKLYRALAYKCLMLGLNPKSEEVAKQIANDTKLEVKYINNEQHVILDSKDVTSLLNSDDVSVASSEISVYKVIREKLKRIQQDLAENQSVIMDGRDIGSVVLPKANFKFYLDADVEVRAKRRYIELIKSGENISYNDVLNDMKERDYRDKNRGISPLVKCTDAIVVNSSFLTVEQVVTTFILYIKGDTNE